MGGKVCLRCKGKTLLGVVKKLWKQKVCWQRPAMPFYLKQTFPIIIWIFTEGEGDWIKSRLPLRIFSTLLFLAFKLLKHEILKPDFLINAQYAIAMKKNIGKTFHVSTHNIDRAVQFKVSTILNEKWSCQRASSLNLPRLRQCALHIRIKSFLNLYS